MYCAIPRLKLKEALQQANSDIQDDANIKRLIQVYQLPRNDMGDFWISFLEITDPKLTVASNFKCPSPATVTEWVKTAWDSHYCKIVFKSPAGTIYRENKISRNTEP